MIAYSVHKPFDIPGSFRIGDEIQCENGHFFARLSGPISDRGWPSLHNNEGVDVTHKFNGQAFPIRCSCSAIAIRRFSDIR